MLFIFLEPIFEHFKKKRMAKLRLKNADKFEAAVQEFVERRKALIEWTLNKERDAHGNLVPFKQVDIDVPEGYEWMEVLMEGVRRKDP